VRFLIGKINKKRLIDLFFQIAPLFLGCLILFELSFLKSIRSEFCVYFLNVGQGDSILVKTPDYKYILIDGGEDKTILEQLGEVLPFWERTIDIVVATHPDKDHIGGLFSVLESYHVGTLYVEKIESPDTNVKKLQASAQENEVKIEELKRGKQIQISELSLLVLWPSEEFISDKNNERSIVMRLTYPGISIMLTGDLEEAQEQELILQGDFLLSNVLKVGHHGSDTSTSELFLQKIRPQLSIISCGKDNKYGHPDDEVLVSLQNINSVVLRTDIIGRIEIVCRKQSCFVRD